MGTATATANVVTETPLETFEELSGPEEVGLLLSLPSLVGGRDGSSMRVQFLLRWRTWILYMCR